VETDLGTLVARHFVVATGAWTETLLAPLGFRLHIKPVRGQIVLLRAPDSALRPAILQGSRYIVPRGDGNLLVGSTEEDVGFDKQTTASTVMDLLRLAVKLVPILSRAAVERAWAGLRPWSPDGSPFIDRLPNLDNIYVAAGHYRSGIQLAPGTAMLIKELILGQPLTMDLEPFRLHRGLASVEASARRGGVGTSG
jgi:glycine oxidase